MSISFMGETVVNVEMGTTYTLGEILYNYDEEQHVYCPECNWLTAEDLRVIMGELKERNK